MVFRHGDVIIASVESIPADARRRPSTILARGEATGHSHRFATAEGVAVLDHEGAGYLSVTADVADLVHDEHATIAVPRGTYRFWQQREYSPKEIRRVVD
ncbi:MAG: hypothetical protein ACAI43_24365 [Phycisphaerae bacterium]